MRWIIYKIVTRMFLIAYNYDKSLLKQFLSRQKLPYSSLDFKYEVYYENYSLDRSFKFNGQFIKFYGEGQIIAGPNSYIGSFSTIQAAKNFKVVIGKNTSISHNVRIYTETSFADQDFSGALKKTKCADVVIGDHVWIGANVFINPGLTIGQNSVVGANSVVTKDIPENSIYGGVPAKLIRYKSNGDDKL